MPKNGKQEGVAATMPRKALKPCAERGCPRLTDRRFCEEHQKAESRRYNRFDRDPALNVRYGANWKKIRAVYIAANPLCERCRAEGRLTPAVLVHHKKKLTDGGGNDAANLMSLCDSCHSRIHAEQGDYWG